MRDKRIAVPIINTVTTCKRCATNENVKRYKRLDKSGWRIIDWCCVCGQIAIQELLPLGTVKDFRQLETFPEHPPKATSVCCVCGSIEKVERHHWAPYKIFGSEAQFWPISLLCRNCHMRWHTLMPNGLTFFESEVAREEIVPPYIKP